MFSDPFPNELTYYLSSYTCNIVWVTEYYGEFQVECKRCGLKKQTSRIGEYADTTELHHLMRTHVCDPALKGK